MDIRTPQVSFVMPVLNDEQHIGDAIDAIKQTVNGKYIFEIIVIDNGSHDNSAEIAKRGGARVLIKPGMTISELRNIGVSNAGSEIIVFVDSDVLLAEEWGSEFRNTLRLLSNEQQIITGSAYSISRIKPGWLEQYWFNSNSRATAPKYINGGHLIMTKTNFQKIGGFRTDLETGEDCDLCQRGRNLGNKIVSNPNLRAFHEGFPKTMSMFFRRERWHGRGDCTSFRTVWRSKPAVMSVTMATLVFVACGLSIWTKNLWVLPICVVVNLALCFAAAYHRCRTFGLRLPIATLLYAVYFLARIFSMIDTLLNKSHSRTKASR
jgi:glycosyltransferase involved in cell wall biosynthesis